MPLTDIQADRIFDNMLSRVEAKLGRKILTNFNKLSLLIRDVINNGGELVTSIVIIENQRELERILIESYEEAIAGGVKFTHQDLQIEELDEDNLNELLILLLLWRIETARRQARFLTQTTIDLFQKAYAEGQVKGLVGEDLSNFTVRKISRLNRSRVPVIATTESNSAIQKGSEQAALRIETELLKRWRSQGDRRVRPTHRRANNRYRSNPIQLNQDFEVGIGHGPYPLSPKLPSDEIIACRCYLRHVLPKSPEA